MTDENTKTERSVMDCVPSDFYDRAYDHYAKAMRKHPRFADALFATTDVASAGQTLQECRDMIACLATNGSVDGVVLALCEISEAQLAHAQGDNAETIEELYDAVAVLMRMIAVVEGKQRLGGEA